MIAFPTQPSPAIAGSSKTVDKRNNLCRSDLYLCVASVENLLCSVQAGTTISWKVWFESWSMQCCIDGNWASVVQITGSEWDWGIERFLDLTKIRPMGLLVLLRWNQLSRLGLARIRIGAVLSGPVEMWRFYTPNKSSKSALYFETIILSQHFLGWIERWSRMTI